MSQDLDNNGDPIEDLPFEKQGDGLRLGVRPKQRKEPMCVCGDGKWGHADLPGPGEGSCAFCPCTKFQAKPKSPRMRSIRAAAKAVERWWAEKLGGKRVPAGVAAQLRSGDLDIRSPNRGIQVKNRNLPAWFIEGWDQAEVGVRGTGLRPLLCITTKPGPGKPARHFVVEEVGYWLDMNGRDGYE